MLSDLNLLFLDYSGVSVISIVFIVLSCLNKSAVCSDLSLSLYFAALD